MNKADLLFFPQSGRKKETLIYGHTNKCKPMTVPSSVNGACDALHVSNRESDHISGYRRLWEEQGVKLSKKKGLP